MSIAEEKIEIITNDEWLSSLKTRVAKTKWVVGRTSGPTIFKVPRIFQEADPKAYEPKMVSLGPYHHGNIHLKAMEDLKWHYLKEFLGRNPGKPLEDYIDQIKEREHEARMAYSEKVDMTSDEFAQMMLLDCCFVIEIIDLWKTYVERQEKEEEEEEELGEAPEKESKSTKKKKLKMSNAEEKSEIITNEEWLSSLKKRADPKAYEPKMVSLGPYHHGNIHLKAMEDLKWHYLKKFLGRNPRMSLEDYIEQIREREDKARMAYSEKVDMTSDEFVQMMLLDCCFVIEIIHSNVEKQEEEKTVDKQIRCTRSWFRTARPMHSVVASTARPMHSLAARQMTMSEKQLRTDGKGTEAVHNPITSTQYTLPVVVRDMLMLENQLPFLLLQTLFKSAFPESADPLENWTLKFVSNFVKSKIENPPNIGIKKIHHILHLWHYYIDPYKKRDGGKPSTSLCHKPNRNNLRRSREDYHTTSLLKWIPSATQLMEAGVHFKKKEATNFLDITFQNGEMGIPLLQVDDDTETFLRNLIAFEQCSKNVSLHVTAYAALMDCIINTAADVALLQQHGIILSGLGDGKQVANLFNKLCKEVTLDYDKSYVSGIYKDVNEHWTNQCNQWRARLNHDYFSNPWAVISVFAAILLFVLTITQTIYSALSYVRPPN
uniref:Uncharacterized protein n=1 Tax=Musa acuminata subsp. malaccensis TaxID=214687 RepID=A0A804IJX5_MUSAM